MTPKEKFLILSKELKECLDEDTISLYRLDVNQDLMRKKQALSDDYMKIVFELPKEEIFSHVLEMEKAFLDNCEAIDQCLKFHKRILEVVKSNETVSYSNKGTLTYRSNVFYQGEDS
jgi:hypothetical protein